MKKILLVLCFLMLSGCAPAEKTDNGKLQVYTSFYCLYDLTSKIGGDRIDIYNMVPTGTEPHDWEPSAHNMSSLSQADVLFYNGLGMENWIDKVEDTLDIRTEELSAYTQNKIDGDPHIWLDPKNADSMSERICTVLCELDGNNADYYKENYANFSDTLKELDSKYKTELDKFDNKKIVVSHQAYGYLCNAYDIEQISIDGISADSEPSPKKMQEIIDIINTENITTVFYEKLVSQKTADTISEETNANLLPLDPFEGLTQEEIDQGADYISVMTTNLENIKTSLER